MPIPLANAGSGGADIAYAAWSGVTTRGLSGTATVYAPAVSVASWAWTLLSKPPGSAASLSGANTQTPTLIDIDSAGNYEIGLVVTDNTAQVSETDPFLMPDAARVTVKATTQFAALYIQAEGQRNYIEERYDEVLEVDSQRGKVDRAAKGLYQGAYYKSPGAGTDYLQSVNNSAARTLIPLGAPADASIAYWMRSSGSAALPAKEHFGCYRNGQPGPNLLIFNDGSDFALDIALDNGSAVTQLLLGANPSTALAGRWIHFAWVFDVAGGNAHAYINGALIDSASLSGWTPAQGADTFRLFGNNSGAAPLNGDMRSVGIFNRALTADEVASLHEAGPGFDARYPIGDYLGEPRIYYGRPMADDVVPDDGLGNLSCSLAKNGNIEGRTVDQDAADSFVVYTVVPIAVITNQSKIIPILGPAGTPPGYVKSAGYTAVDAPTSGGTITAQIRRNSDNAVISDALAIQGSAGAAFANIDQSVAWGTGGGCHVHVVSSLPGDTVGETLAVHVQYVRTGS